MTWTVACLHALGGFLVAAVMLYADNISKCFAMALSLVVSRCRSPRAGVVKTFENGSHRSEGQPLGRVQVWAEIMGGGNHPWESVASRIDGALRS